MKLRIRCKCRQVLTAGPEQSGGTVECPNCGATLRVPDTASVAAVRTSTAPTVAAWKPAEPAAATGPTVFQSRESEPTADRPRRSWRWLLLALVFLLPLGVVATLIFFPLLGTRDPRAVVVRRYIKSVLAADWAEANRLSVLTAHPRFDDASDVVVDSEFPTLRGRVAGLAEFHNRIQKQYRYVADRKRFEPKDMTGVGLDVLGGIEKAAKDLEKQLTENASQPRSGRNAEDALLDDVIARYKVITNLPGNPLSAEGLGPTYADLLAKSDVALSAEERMLAVSFGEEPDKWERLLGQSVLSIPAGAEFELQQADVRIVTRRPGQSQAEPGQTIALRLVRFRIGIIDTHWKVWEAGTP